ncbi:MAG: HAD family hydrolase [Alloprevotella sp.]
MLTTLIFDLDGTLLDTLDDLTDSVNYALSRHGLPRRTKAEVRRFLGNGIQSLMRQAVGQDTLPDDGFETVFRTFRTHYVEHCFDRTQPYPGIMSMLVQLQAHGIKTAIVSNKLHEAVQELNRRFFSTYIDIAVGESATVRRKPNPDAVLCALQQLGSTREEAVYVGDSEVDWQTARNAGLRVALVEWGFRDASYLHTLSPVSHFAPTAADLTQWAMAMSNDNV